MRLPRPRQAAHAQGSATRTNTTDSRVEKHQDYNQDVPVDVEPGSAMVAATRGFKHWFSGQDGGLTVEATMTVTLTCKPDVDSVGIAGEEAGKRAERLAVAGCEDMDLYIKKFIEDLR